MKRMIELNGRTIEYELERKSVKNLNLRIRYDGKVFVSASPDVPPEQIDSFVERKQNLQHDYPDYLSYDQQSHELAQNNPDYYLNAMHTDEVINNPYISAGDYPDELY